MDLDVEDVVWAKMRGYPYWPARITAEASSGTFKKGSGSSTKVHVEFLGGEWVPSWIPRSLVRKFQAEDTGPNRKKEYRASARWEVSHLAAMKIGLDRLLEKGGLTIRTEPNRDKEFSPAQDSLTTQQGMGVTQEESDARVSMSKELSLCKNEASAQREDSQFYTPEQELTLASPDQQFFTPRLNHSVPSQAKLTSREGRSGIKISAEDIKLESGQWSSTPGTTDLLLPGKGRLNSLKQKKTMKNKQKSVDMTWRRRSRRQSMTPCAREEPDLVSSLQLDADWKIPYKCRLCRTKFGWTADRDSHELICEGEVQDNANRDSHELICEGEVQGNIEYGVNCQVISPTEKQVAKNDNSTIVIQEAIKVDSTTASDSTANDDWTTSSKFATTANGKDDSQTGSQLNIKDLAKESCFNVKLSMAENIEVEFGQPLDDRNNVQFIDQDFQDMELEPELYVGNYAEVEWRTEDSGLEGNGCLVEGMEKVFSEDADSRQGIIESSAGTEESMAMEVNEGNDGDNTSVNTGLKRKIDLQDGDEDTYDLIMKRRRISVIEPASLVKKDMNANETDDHKLDKNLNNASHVTYEMGLQDVNYAVEISDIQGNDQTFLVDNQVLDKLGASPEIADFGPRIESLEVDRPADVHENMGVSSDKIVDAKDSSVSPFYNLIIDEDCSSEEMLLVNVKTIDSYENNDNASEVNSPTINENSFRENPPIISFDQSSVDSLVRSDNSRNSFKNADVSSVESVALKLARSSDGCSHMGSPVETFEWNDKAFPEGGTTFDPPISSTKLYPKMNSLKDEKKMSPKYENCILPPRVKTKAEIKEYDYIRIIEKSNASSQSNENPDKKNKSPLLAQKKVNLLKQTCNGAKLGTSNQDNVKLETKSNDKLKSTTKYHDKVKLATKYHVKGKSVSKSLDQGKLAIKTDDKVKLTTKTDDKGKLTTKTDDKGKSATRTDDKGKSATRTDDKGKLATKTDDKGKLATKSHDQGKSAIKTQDQGKSRTQTHDKVKSIAETRDKVKSETQTQDVKLAIQTFRKDKLAAKSHGKGKLSIHVHDGGKLPAKSNYKLPANISNDSKLPAKTSNEGKLPAKTPNGDKLPAKTPNDGKLPAKTSNEGKLPAKAYNDRKLPPKIPNDGKLPAKTPNDGKFHAKTSIDGKLPAKTPDEDKLAINTSNEGKLPKQTHDAGKMLTYTHSKRKLPTKYHDKRNVVSKSHNESVQTYDHRRLSTRPHDTDHKSQLLTQTSDKNQFYKEQFCDKNPHLSNVSQVSSIKQHKSGRANVHLQESIKIHSMDTFTRDKEEGHKKQKNVSNIKKSSELSSKRFQDIKASNRDQSSKHSLEEPLKKGDKIFSRYRIEKKDKPLSTNEDNPNVMINYANRRADSSKTTSSRHGTNFRQKIKEPCKYSSKTTSSRDDDNLKERDKYASKSTSTKHGANLKETYKESFKATSTKHDANFKRESKEDYKHSLKNTSAKHDAIVKDKRREHSGYFRRLIDDKHGRNLSKDSKTKTYSHSEQSFRPPLKEYRKPLLGDKDELKSKSDRYRFEDKSTDVAKCWSRYSSPASSPDAEDKHWKRQKGCPTQNYYLKDEIPDTRNEYKFDKDEDENVRNKDATLYDIGGEQCYEHHTRRDNSEYQQQKDSYELNKNEFQHSNSEYKKEVQTNTTGGNLIKRPYEEMPEKLSDCQASVENEGSKNGKLTIPNLKEIASTSNFGSPLSECSEFKDVEVEQEENPACSDKIEEVPTRYLEEHDAHKFQNFSYNDTNKLEEFPVCYTNDLRELPKYDVSTTTLNGLPSKNIFDSHCHLDILFYKLAAPHRFREGYLLAQVKTLSEFKKHYKEEIHDKFEGCVTNFCDPKQWNVMQAIPDLIRSLDREDGVYYTVGCHPRHSEYMMSRKSREALERIVKWGKGKAGKCVAIGECGLDLNPNKRNAPFHTQKIIFKFQLELAMKLDFPLVLHIRDAEEEAYAVMQEVGLPSDHPIHRHCFNNSWSACQKWMKMFPRSFIGLTNLLLNPGVKHLHQVARLIPLERLILETDSPYFSPRDQNRDFPVDMSHPGDVVHVAALVAALREDSLENILAANRRNIATLYGIKKKPVAKPRQGRVDGRKR